MVSQLCLSESKVAHLNMKALLMADLCNWDQLVEVAEALRECKCNSQELITGRARACCNGVEHFAYKLHACSFC